MKKISLKSLTAVLLIAALVSTMVMIHSTAASDDFKVTYKTVLDSLNGISGPTTLNDAVTEDTADSYDGANTAFKSLSESEKSELNGTYNDIANKLDACSRRAKIFTEGSFFVDFEADKDLLKYLAVATNSNKNYTFTTVQHGTAIPEITETFIYEGYGDELGFYLDGNNVKQNNYNEKGNFTDVLTSRSNVNGTDAPPVISTQFGLYTYDGKVCLSAAGSYTNQPRLFVTADSGAHGWAFGGYAEPFKRDSAGNPTTEIGNLFYVGEIVDGVYTPYTLTAKVSYKAYDDALYYASLSLGSEYQVFCNNHNVSGYTDSRYTKDTIATSVQININDFSGLTPKTKHVKTLTVSYPEILAVKCAEADAYANTLDVSKITASMADVINKYYSLSVACGDNEYITAENKTKLATAKKVIDYLVAHSLESITTAQSINELNTNITDTNKVTDLYDEVQQVIGLGLGGMFSDAQIAKIESMKNAVALMTGATYDATDLVAAATGITELNKKQIVNDIAFEISLSSLEKAVKALGDFSSAVSNSAVLSQIRTAYNALVESGEYTDVSNYTFTKTGKRYTAADGTLWGQKDTGVVSYISSPSLGAGIDRISYTIPVAGYDKPSNSFVYSYGGINSEGYATMSAISFYARNDYPQWVNGAYDFTAHKETFDSPTLRIPQDTSYDMYSINNYGNSNYIERSTTGDVPKDVNGTMSLNNNLIWYVNKDDVGKLNNTEAKAAFARFKTDNNYSTFVPYGERNIVMEYQGDANTVKGFNWYLITISGQFCTGVENNTPNVVDGTVYCRLFTKGRITTAGVTHDAAVEPSTVLTNLSIKVNRKPNTLTNGASVRLANVNNGGGIRFESTVNKELYNNLKASGLSVELGTIIVPYDYVDGKEITFSNFSTTGTAANKDKCLDIKQTKWQDEENGVYTAAMINIKSGNYGRSFAARGYMKVTYANGDEQYFYSDFDETANVRSIAEVAKAALESGKYDDNETAKTILNTYVGTTN